MNLAGKTLINFGGTGGIGFHVAAAFLQAGANVCIVGRNIQRIDEKKLELGNPPNLIGIVANADNLVDVRNVFAETEKTFGPLDGGVFVGIGEWVITHESSDTKTLREAEEVMRPTLVTALGIIAGETARAFNEKDGVLFHVSSHVVHKPESKLPGNVIYRKLKIEAEKLLEKYKSKFQIVNLRPSIVSTPKNDATLTEGGVDQRSKAVDPRDIADWCVQNFINPEIPLVMNFESEVVVGSGVEV